MVNYRRDYTNGAIYFFTLTLQNRQSDYLIKYIDLLGEAFRYVRTKCYFTTHAIAVLPDHLHVIWELPQRIVITLCAGGLLRQVLLKE